MITFWWEQMRGRFEMDPGDAAVRLSFPYLDALGADSWPWGL